MEKNEQSRIDDPDGPDIVDTPDDPNDPVVTTDDPNTCDLVTNTLKEIRAEQEKAPVPYPSPPPPLPKPEALRNLSLSDDYCDEGEYSMGIHHDICEEREHPTVKLNSGNNTDPEADSETSYGYCSREIHIIINQLEEFLKGDSLKNIHEPVSQCCIYKVPRDLCKINYKAYTPQMISIGPFHHGDNDLIEMEKQKLRYMSEFCEREGAQKLEGFRRYIKANKKNIRNYYQEKNSSLEGHSFVNMILCDAIFIIEFFLKNANEERKQKKVFDFFLDTTCVKAAITRDLQLLENQLPYFLLKNLFEKGAFHNFTKENYPDHDPFLILSHRFFFGDFPKLNNQIQQCEIQHFTDLRRYFLLMDFLPRDQKQGEHVRDSPTAGDQNQGEHVRGTAGDQKQGEHVRDSPTAGDQNQGEHVRGTAGDQKQGEHVRDSPTAGDQNQGEHVRGTAGDQNQGEHVRDLPTATKLHGSGVKFKKGIEGGNPLEISCEYVPRAMRIPGFKGREIRIPFIKGLRLRIPGFKGREIPIPFIKELELQIPRLEIDDRSECLYRNMMALELCHYPSKTHICNFVLLMDFLINTEKDVDLFVEEGIIFSLLGDNAAVAKMFNNLSSQITPSFSVYHNIGEKLKAHYARPWNRTMANLKTVYFVDIWKGTGTVAAVILLVLTFIQAVCSILSLTSFSM